MMLSSISLQTKRRLIIDYSLLIATLSLIPLSILFQESTQINSYFSTIILIILVILCGIRNIIRKEKIQLSRVDLLTVCVLLISLISSYVKCGEIIFGTIYLNFILYCCFLIISKFIFRLPQYVSYLKKTIVLVNVFTIICMLFTYIKGEYYISYINIHFSNTGVFAVFLSVSSIVLCDFLLKLDKKKQFLVLLLFIINFIIILFLESRISIFITLIYPIYRYMNNRLKKKRIIRIYLYMFCCFLAVFLFLFVKRDSTDGRLLILKISTYIIRDNYIIGTGGLNTFPIKYPLYQAQYFSLKDRPNIEIMNADNIRYALNEPIQTLCELGLISGIILLFILYLSFKILDKYDNSLRNIFFILLFFSCFYYIFHITIFQNCLVLILAYISIKDNTSIKLKSLKSRLFYFFAIFSCIQVSHHSFFKLKKSIDLNSKIHLRSFHFTNIDSETIESYFYDNPYFLGLYAHFLYDTKKYMKLKLILDLLDKNLINSESEFLRGKMSIRLNCVNTAKFHLKQASNICPNRFRYKHELFQLYLNENDQKSAIEIALSIHSLAEKIPSPTTLAIKQEAERFLKTHKNEIYNK